jgi:hypothetical protein
MKVMLGLKLGRRLTAAAAFSDEMFVFHDVRSVSSRADTLDAGITRYLQTLLEQLKPAHVYYYAPTSTQTTTGRLVLLVEQAAANHGIPARRLAKSDVFGSAGARPARTRRELRDQLQHLWPTLSEGKFIRQAVLAEAAAAALVGELRDEWPPA